jgi:thioredoxin reductase
VYDLIIIGGGPAGLTATVYAVNKRLETVLVSDNLGGKANYKMRLRGMEGFEHVTGEEIVRRFKSQVEYLDYACRSDRATRLEEVAAPGNSPQFRVTTASGSVLVGRAVVVATGARPRTLGCPGEQEFLGRGVSYSAVSHAALYWGRDAVVVGSGRLALRAAAELAGLANHVYLISAQPLPTGAPLAGQLAAQENVKVMAGAELVSIAGTDFVTEITVRDADGEAKVVPAQGVFVELGLDPDSDLVRGICDLDADGYIVVDSRGATTKPGVYAAGDVASTYAEQVLIAVGDGAKASLAAFEYLLEHPQLATDTPSTA